ncbi:MAG: translesion error-prone DNA polymerase V autoproteolytic subunit [Muribaculaceae bacterium]|nr:translesion error-prone DNA polymerase V autoproteolytic subunit [Muribaculaceae bacterium]
MDNLDIKLIKSSGENPIQFTESHVQAGFPSPAQGSFGDAIDLNRALIDSPTSTFCARVSGNSMIDAGIGDGDLIIIDKALDPHDGDIAVCFVDGEFTVKRIALRHDGLYLVAANKRYPDLRIGTESHFMIWGIVTYIIHRTAAP